MVILIVYVSKTHTCVGNVMKIFFFKLLWKTESGFIWVVEPFPAPMENWTSVGGFEVSNSLCFDTILFNHSVSLVLQAMFLQLTLKSECGLLFLMEVLEGLSLTHLTGVQRKPWAGNTPAVTRVIYLVSPASNFSPAPPRKPLLRQSKSGCWYLLFFPFDTVWESAPRLAQRMWTSVTDELDAEICVLGEVVFTHISIL